MDHDRHARARYLFPGIQFGASIVNNLVPESIDPIHKLPPQAVVLQLIQMMDHFLLVDRSHQSQTLPQGEVCHDTSLYVIGVLITNLILSAEAVLKICVCCDLSVVFVFKLKHKISEEPHEFRHKSD